MSDTTQAPTVPLPLFFKSIVPIDINSHTGLRFDRNASVNFSRHTNAVPLGMSEITIAAQYYPIIFTADPNPVPLAVLGHKASENLYVEPDGKWVPDLYVPAYIRAYPFIIADHQERQRSILAADLEAEAFHTGNGDHLFKMEKPTPFIEEVFQFCSALRDDFRRAAEFGMGLEKAKLFEVSQANIKLKSGEDVNISGFKLVNSKKFDSANDKTFLAWRKNGWLGACYAHFLSGSRWDRIIQRASETSEAQALS